MTRKKLARSSGCIVEYVGYTVFMSGSKAERDRAQEYLGWLFEQLKGPVYVDGWEERDDVTMVDVPRDCVGYVTGARRATLGKIEEEWGTLMFFMSTNMRAADRMDEGGRREFDGSEKLAIFGSRRGRRGAELKCMSAVETKRPGYFTRDVNKHTSESEGFASDTYPMDESELSYALGKDGTTRRKLARASGCIMEYVGQVAFICGTIEERTRARTYLKWLLKQRNGSVYVDDLTDRDDVTKVPLYIYRKSVLFGASDEQIAVFLKPDEAVALLRSNNRAIAALTYGWVTPDHPDETDEYLAAMRRFLNHPLGAHIGGCFWDFGSLPQKPRSAEEAKGFNVALGCMGDVYASAMGTTVVRHKTIPKRPEGHESQTDAPLASWYVPGGHAEQRSAPLGSFEKVPFVHSWQSVRSRSGRM